MTVLFIAIFYLIHLLDIYHYYIIIILFLSHLYFDSHAGLYLGIGQDIEGISGWW